MEKCDFPTRSKYKISASKLSKSFHRTNKPKGFGKWGALMEKCDFPTHRKPDDSAYSQKNIVIILKRRERSGRRLRAEIFASKKNLAALRAFVEQNGLQERTDVLSLNSTGKKLF